MLEKGVGRRLGRLITLAVTVAFISHLVACVYWIIGRIQGFGVTTFYPDAGIVNRDPHTRYLQSLYVALNLVSGVGDTPTPETDLEIIFVLLVRIAGMSIYASIIGNVGALISERDPSTVLFEDKVNSVRLFMKYHRLPPDLEKRVLNHYKLLWERQKGMREMEVLNDLPSALRSEVTLLLNSDVLCKVSITYLRVTSWGVYFFEFFVQVPLFEAVGPSFIIAISQYLLPQVCVCVCMYGCVCVRERERKVMSAIIWMEWTNQ